MPPPNRRCNSRDEVREIKVPSQRRTALSTLVTLIDCRTPPRPSFRKAFTAFGHRAIPAPTSASAALRSYTCASTPRLCSAIAAVKPPMPPPMMMARILVLAVLVAVLAYAALLSIKAGSGGEYRECAGDGDEYKALHDLGMVALLRSTTTADNILREHRSIK